MRLRLRTFLPLSATAAAAALPLVLAAPGTALANPRPTCAAPDTRTFPVKTRIHGGPASYDVGGDFRTWYIDLTNTTAHTCGDIHPIVVLVDEKRALRPEQARLEFYEGAEKGEGRDPHPVEFEKSDEDENVGAFDDGFPGFTVGPGRTLTVKVRLSVTSDAAVPNDVVANAAVVQRHDDDGDWVGESNDYRFRIEDEGEGEGVEEEDSGGDSELGTWAGSGSGDGGVVREEGAASGADELASTGPRAQHGFGVTVGLGLFAAGAVLLAVSRWVRLRW
ncbi:hypothetical protein [Streptomyces sp. NBC_00038]|uniref:hypothetical protein n=1 Tax=Streptomyces sp. NBC_00038 TaxID=2903615 RepID=UPI0022557B0A|nr:hypothetical protein [Streptomyces sp. NBC_00038]MCX5557983.1 hypothetical protein [Streptomyces sp. NBC_00038]